MQAVRRVGSLYRPKRAIASRALPLLRYCTDFTVPQMDSEADRGKHLIQCAQRRVKKRRLATGLGFRLVAPSRHWVST